jgi:hypothetical protein
VQQLATSSAVVERVNELEEERFTPPSRAFEEGIASPYKTNAALVVRQNLGLSNS